MRDVFRAVEHNDLGCDNMTQRTRAALYLRVSTTRQEEGYSLETQEAGCRAYAAQHGLDVDEAHVYQEVFTGVELWERPQLTRLREAIHRQQIDAVICYAIDRLARDDRTTTGGR